MTARRPIIPFVMASMVLHAAAFTLAAPGRLEVVPERDGEGGVVSVRLRAPPVKRAQAPEPRVADPRADPLATAPSADPPGDIRDPALHVAVDRAPPVNQQTATARIQESAPGTELPGDGPAAREQPVRSTPETSPPRPDEPPTKRAVKTPSKPAGAPSRPASRVRDAITAQLAKYFRYPRDARQRGWEGTVVLSVRVLGDGRLVDIQVESSSGRRLLDRSAQRALARVKRLPELAGRVGDGLTLEIPITYRLETT